MDVDARERVAVRFGTCVGLVVGYMMSFGFAVVSAPTWMPLLWGLIASIDLVRAIRDAVRL